MKVKLFVKMYICSLPILLSGRLRSLLLWYLLREARAQPPNLVNLYGAEIFRSTSLSSRDFVRHKNPSLLVINYSVIVSTTKVRVLSNRTTKPMKFCKYQCSILCHRLFKCELSDMWAKRITYVLSNGLRESC